MTTTAQRPRPGVPGPALDRAAEAWEARQAAEVALLRAAVEWAEANPAAPGVETCRWGDVTVG